jgi:hypothetical protein
MPGVPDQRTILPVKSKDFLKSFLEHFLLIVKAAKLIRPEAAGFGMDRKEIVKLCMECPLYFTMPVRQRLNFVKKREQANSGNGLREALLSWVKTGQFLSPP